MSNCNCLKARASETREKGNCVRMGNGDSALEIERENERMVRETLSVR